MEVTDAHKASDARDNERHCLYCLSQKPERLKLHAMCLSVIDTTFVEAAVASRMCWLDELYAFSPNKASTDAQRSRGKAEREKLNINYLPRYYGALTSTNAMKGDRQLKSGRQYNAFVKDGR
jgi:hypothetical protein